jgi:hypothetical protein
MRVFDLLRQARNGVKVSVKYLVERFTSKPYGWPTTAVLCLAGSLVAKGKVEARVDSTVTEGLDLANALNNSHALANILLTPQQEFSAAEIRKAKELYQELFSKPASGNDARSLGAEWAASITELEADVDDKTRQVHAYPFMTARLIPFVPAAQDVVPPGLQICDVRLLFRSCQPDGKTIDLCPAKRSTRFFSMRKRVRSIWQNDAGRTASSAPLVAPARVGLSSEIGRPGNVLAARDRHP